MKQEHLSSNIIPNLETSGPVAENNHQEGKVYLFAMVKVPAMNAIFLQVY